MSWKEQTVAERRWIIEGAYYTDGVVSFCYRGRPVPRVTIIRLNENGFRYDGGDGRFDVDWDGVSAVCYHQPTRRIGEIRGPGDVTWVDSETEWPCEHCRTGDHQPCPAPTDGGLQLCCCDDPPLALDLERMALLEELGRLPVPFASDAAARSYPTCAELLERARARGWKHRWAPNAG